MLTVETFNTTNILIFLQCTYHQFHWNATPESKLLRTFGNLLPSIMPFLYINAALVFKTMAATVASSFNVVACYSSSLLSQVAFLLVQGLSVSVTARCLHAGKTFVKKIRQSYRNTSMVDQPARTGKARQMDGRWKPSFRSAKAFWNPVSPSKWTGSLVKDGATPSSPPAVSF